MWVLLSVTVIVIVLTPKMRGTLAAVQAGPAFCAVPEYPPLVAHVNTIGPLPPVAEPDSAIADALVAAPAAFTMSVIGT